MTQRRPKKSESIEVRVTHEVKQAFMEKAAVEGQSASEIVRRSIANYVRGREVGRGLTKRLWARAAALGAVGAALIFVYSIGTPAKADREYLRAFKAARARLDNDRSGTIDRKEFANQWVLIMSPSSRNTGAFAAQIRGPSGSLASSLELRRQFAEEDTDQDGQITATEYAAYRRTVKHRGFAILDINSDGRLSFAEYRELIGVPPGDLGRKLFNSRDSNRDGSLTEDEFDL